MGNADGSILIRTKVDDTGIKKGLSGISTSLAKIGGLVAAAFSVGVLVKFGKQAIELASDLQEVQNVVDTAFGSMSYKMEEFAKTAVETYGISKLTAKQTGSVFMAMSVGMGVASDSASDMAIALTGLSADMASFYNVEQSVASTALKSVFTGETETLKQFGIVMTEANLSAFALSQGITKSYQSMSQAEKVMLRYQYVMAQTTLAQGDFAKTSNSWANQTRILSERWKEFLSIAGSGLIQVFTPVITLLNTVLSLAISALNVLSELFGWSTSYETATAGIASNIGESVDAENELADATKSANKQAQKQLAFFDDIHTLEQKSASGGGAGAGGVGAGALTTTTTPKDVDNTNKLNKNLKQIKDYLTDIAGLVKEGFLDGLGSDFADRLQDVKDNLAKIKNAMVDIFTDPNVVKAADRFVKTLAYSIGSIAGSMASIGLSIAQNVVGGIAKYLQRNTKVIKDYLVTIFDIGSETATLYANFYKALDTIFKAIGGESGQEFTSYIVEIFANAFMGITEISAKLSRDILTLMFQPIIDNQDEIRNSLDKTFGSINVLLAQIADTITNTFAQVNAMYDRNIKPLFETVTKGLSDLLGEMLKVYNENILPIISGIIQKIQELKETKLSGTIQNFISLIGNLANLLQVLWQTIIMPLATYVIDYIFPTMAEVFGNLVTMFIDAFGNFTIIIDAIIERLNFLIQFLIDVFSGNWNKVWEDLTNNVGTLFKAMVSVIKFELNTVIGFVNNMISAVIKGINFVIKAINNLIKGYNNVASKFGGPSINTFDIIDSSSFKIPYLAKGAVIPPNKQFMAVLGDQTHGTNIETPLETMIDAFKTAFAEMGGGNGGGNVILNIDGQEFARLQLPGIMSEMNRKGYNVDLLTEG